MSGIISGMNYSLLFGGNDSSDASNLIDVIYNGASGSAGSTDPLTALQVAEQNKTADIAQEAKDPTVVRDIAAFQQGIANAKTIQDALANPDVLKVFLTANNLGDSLGFTALAQKALMSDPNDANSLAKQLASTNGAWLTAAQTYDFAKNGLAELQNPQVQATLTHAYAQIQWEQSLDQQTPGLSSAMQFQSQAASITNVDQILGDPVNRDVVLTALNIPLQIAYQDLQAQENAVTSKLNITQLQNPQYVQALVQQYLLNKAQTAASSGSTDFTTLAVQAGGGIIV